MKPNSYKENLSISSTNIKAISIDISKDTSISHPIGARRIDSEVGPRRKGFSTVSLGSIPPQIVKIYGKIPISKREILDKY
jgi:hypothetical protein